MNFLFGIILLGLCVACGAHAADYAEALNQRYVPYADWAEHLDLSRIESAETISWWRSPDEVREQGKDPERPLSGLHLALDPGHIGGEWANVEGRDFRIQPQDFAVREGELVLEVARLVEADLVRMGARVTLLRDGIFPLNPKGPEAYFTAAAKRVEIPGEFSWAAFMNYGKSLRGVMNRMSIVSGELIERARIVNQELRPDALISLHINAAPWPLGKDGAVKYELVDSNHTHVLIFGCLSEAELSVPRQKVQLVVKMTNGSAAIERELGEALGVSLGRGTGLPPSLYDGRNAIRLKGQTPYLWARNLLLLRYVQCPVVLLEPYIANSKGTYPRIQAALQSRRMGQPLAEDDILVEYAQSVVEGILTVYGPEHE